MSLSDKLKWFCSLHWAKLQVTSTMPHFWKKQVWLSSSWKIKLNSCSCQGHLCKWTDETHFVKDFLIYKNVLHTVNADNNPFIPQVSFTFKCWLSYVPSENFITKSLFSVPQLTSEADLEQLASSTQILTSNPENLTANDIKTAVEIANTLLLSPNATEVQANTTQIDFFLLEVYS